MSYDVNLLHDRAQCAAAKDSLEAELDGYLNQDQNADFRDRKTGRASVTTAARLAGYASRIAYLTAELDRPSLPAADRDRYQDELDTATLLHKRLTRRSNKAGGAAAFLAEVDAEQLAKQVEVLTAALAAVQQRHDELPA